MSENVPTDAGAVPSPVALLQMMTGYWSSQAVYVAAKLGLADRLADGPKSAKELAAATDTDPSSLYRVMRALASVSVFTETSSGHFGLTPMADLLRSGTPESMRTLAMVYAEELYRAWGDFLYSVRTGKPAFDHMFGMNAFEYFEKNPEAGRIFNEAMVGYTNQVAAAVAQGYDFSSSGTIVDVGGGYGTLLTATLRKAPSTKGVLFDLPHVISSAEGAITASGVADRCERIGGDFFESVPAGDTYLLSQILHDWDDARCVKILQNCRKAMSANGRLLVVELVLPPGDQPSFGKWLDLHMLAVAPGGRERTEAEYEVLFRAAGFTLERVVPTAAGPSIVEGIPA